jgi:hypothetical protein
VQLGRKPSTEAEVFGQNVHRTHCRANSYDVKEERTGVQLSYKTRIVSEMYFRRTVSANRSFRTKMRLVRSSALLDESGG